MNLKKGNLVKVLAGKDKNKSGEIIEIINSIIYNCSARSYFGRER